MCRVWRGYEIAGVGGGEFTLRLVPRQKVAPLYWRSDTHTHTLGNTFIDGAHMVLAGPARGQLHLLYQNSEVNEQFLSYLPNVYVLTYTSISAKRSTSHTGVVMQSLAPGLKPRIDSEQWILAGIWPHIEQLLFSVFLTKPTYKIWPSWA
jgi:hypothetical protein